MSNITKAKREKIRNDIIGYYSSLSTTTEIEQIDAILKKHLSPGLRANSAKGKGRKIQNWLRDEVQSYLNRRFMLSDPDHVRSTPMGVSGEDLLLSPGARSHFPFAPECKNQEKVGFWPTVRQAVANAGKHIPLIVFAKNHTQSWIAIPADAWFAMLHLAASDVGPHDTLKEYLDDAKNQIQERQA